MNSVVSLPLSLRFYGVGKLCVQVSSSQRSFICDFLALLLRPVVACVCFEKL